MVFYVMYFSQKRGVLMVYLNRDEIRVCYDFAVQAVNGDYQQGNNFGQGNAIRPSNHSIADKITGKMGEYLFKKTLESEYNNVSVELNFNHFEGHNNLDDGDADIYVDDILQNSQYTLDVKTSSNRAKWLLIEESKFEINGVYPFIKLAENVPINSDLRRNPDGILDFETIEGTFVGWATGADFFSLVDNESICFRFKRGESLYKPEYIPDDFREYGVTELINQINLNGRIDAPNALNIKMGPPLKAAVNFGFPESFFREPNQFLGFYLNNIR